MVASSTERSQQLRERRKVKNLKQLSFWVAPEDEVLARSIIKTFELIALQDEKEARESLRKASLEGHVKNWDEWLILRPTPKTQQVSSQRQRLEAYRVARAANVELPDDLVFSDFYLLRDWIAKQIREHKTGLGQNFVRAAESDDS